MRPGILTLSICAALAATTLVVHAADVGQGVPIKAAPVAIPDYAWTFQFTPYLWAAGLKGDIALGPAVPPVGIDLGFMDMLKHLKMAFMGTFEARYGRLGLIADISYLHAKDQATGPFGFTNASLVDKTSFGTFLGAYRVVDQKSNWIDVVGGGRLWWRRDELDITAPIVGAISATKEKAWLDPIIGIRARAYLGPQIYAEVYGDVGGFGVAAKSDWQVMGTLGYQYSPTTSFFGGYRYLAVDYNRNGYVWDVKLAGPIFGASFKF
jgi:hypothetical protein